MKGVQNVTEIIELINERVTLRRYQKKAISEEHMNAILHGAMRAPTAGNMMSYSIIKINDEETKKQLSKTCDNQPIIAQAATILIFCADFQRWFDYYVNSDVEKACSERGVEFRTPQEGEFFSGMTDAIIASSYGALTAESLGIGSCYIGDIVEHYEIHKELLGLPQWVLPVGMLILGYYPENYRRDIKPRFDRKYIVSEEKYHRQSAQELEEMFESRVVGFKEKNKFDAENFGQFNYFRKTGAEYSKERLRSFRLMLESWKEKPTENNK